MIVRVSVIVNNDSSFKLSVSKRDANDLGLKRGERWEIDTLRPITKNTIIEERKKRFEDTIPVEAPRDVIKR